MHCFAFLGQLLYEVRQQGKTLRLGLAEDHTVNLVKLVPAGPIIVNSLHLESGSSEFAYEDCLRHAVPSSVFGHALRN